MKARTSVLLEAVTSVLSGEPRTDHLDETELLATTLVVANTWGVRVRAGETKLSWNRPKTDEDVAFNAIVAAWMCTIPTWMAFLALRNAGGGKEGKGLTGMGWLTDKRAGWMPIFHAIHVGMTNRNDW